MNLSPREMKWLRLKWMRVRSSQIQADKSSEAWADMNKAFKAWCREMGHTDPADIARVKSENLELKDHMSSWDWHTREANRHMQDIITFKAMKDMEALGMSGHEDS